MCLFAFQQLFERGCHLCVFCLISQLGFFHLPGKDTRPIEIGNKETCS